MATFPGLYRELYTVRSEGEFVLPLSWASVFRLDQQEVLVTNDPVDGNSGYCSDGYCSLDASGANPIDFSRVDKALASHAPAGSSIVEKRCWALDMAAETIHTFAKKPDTCHACGYTADITLHFRLQRHLAIPGSVEVKPMDGD